MSADDRRKYVRFQAPVLYRSASLFSRREPLVNIGLGGIRIYGDEPLKIGRRLELELFFPDRTSMVCTARVVWQQALPEGSVAKYDIGLEFLGISPDGLGRLKKVLENAPPDESG